MNIKIYRNGKLDRRDRIITVTKEKLTPKLRAIDYVFKNHKLP